MHQESATRGPAGKVLPGDRAPRPWPLPQQDPCRGTATRPLYPAGSPAPREDTPLSHAGRMAQGRGVNLSGPQFPHSERRDPGHFQSRGPATPAGGGARLSRNLRIPKGPVSLHGAPSSCLSQDAGPLRRARETGTSTHFQGGVGTWHEVQPFPCSEEKQARGNAAFRIRARDQEALPTEEAEKG